MGGSTPLALGLVTTIELLELVGNKFGETVVLLFTDGRSNVPRRGGLNLRAFRQVKIESELRELTVALNRTRARVIVVDTQKNSNRAKTHGACGDFARPIREDLTIRVNPWLKQSLKMSAMRKSSRFTNNAGNRTD